MPREQRPTLADLPANDEAPSEAPADDAQAAADAGVEPHAADTSVASGHASGQYRGEFDSAIVNGFQIAAGSGPLCDEPLAGVAFFVEAVHVHLDTDDSGT